MKKQTILIVDDEENILSALKRTFWKEPYEVILADSGKKALELCEQHHVDLIISDYKMPEMTGCELLAIIKHKYPSISRIILSGYADANYILSAINEGSIQKYFLKPWDNAELKKEISTLLAEKNAEPDNMIEELSHDSITGLIGARKLSAALKIETSKDNAVTNFQIIMINLTNLNSIIENAGIKLGNNILIDFSNFLKNLNDSFIKARLNSHTFAVACLNTSYSDVQHYIKTIHDYVNQINNSEKYNYLIKLFVSTSSYPEDSRDIDEVINKAENSARFYKSNSIIEKTISCKEKRTIDSYDVFKLEKELFKAIQADDIFVNLQPIYSCQKKEVVAAEVLARWQYQDNLVPPDVFIPLSNDNGTIIPLTIAVLKKSLSVLSHINKNVNPSVSLSINIPPFFLQSSSFEETFYEMLDEFSVSAKNIQLEITEDSFLDFNISNIEVINSLRRSGVSFAIDDFGTGYTSFNYLKNFKIDTLKIDRMFIYDLDNEGESYYLVKTIIDMAKALNIKVVAEGAESNKQFCMLQSMGCDMIQGFYVDIPLSVEDFNKKLEYKQFFQKAK